MKNLLKLSVIILGLALYLMPVSQANAAACVLNGDNEITNTITATESSWCTVTPDYASFPLYKLGLCSTIPTYENYQTVCSFIVDNAVAQDLEISEGSSLSIADEISLAEGVYPAAVILLGNEISLKHTAAFSVDQNGWEIGVGEAAGNRCATSTSSGSQDDINTSTFGGFFNCIPEADEDELTAGWFTETQGAYLAVDANDDPATCSISSGAIVAASSELEFTTSSGSSVVCGMADASTLEQYNSSDETNATRQLIVQTFNTPVEITANSTSFDFGIKLTNMLSLEAYDGPNISGSSAEYLNGFIDGVEFKAVVN